MSPGSRSHDCGRCATYTRWEVLQTVGAEVVCARVLAVFSAGVQACRQTQARAVAQVEFVCFQNGTTLVKIGIETCDMSLNETIAIRR